MNTTLPHRLVRVLAISTLILSNACARGNRFALASCPELRAPAGSALALHVHASGVQIYRWSGTTWTFIAPEAVLTDDVRGTKIIGRHYAGPTWESDSGSKVVGTVLRRCTPDSTAIPWLSLSGVSSNARGLFQHISFIQRVKTAGGIAPPRAGIVTGEVARVPYSAEYLFYRAR